MHLSSRVTSEKLYKSIDGFDNPRDPDNMAKRIVNTASKYCVLCSVAIVSSQFELSRVFVHGMIWIDDNYYRTNYVHLITISGVLFVMDCAINSVCILLTFSFQKKLYSELCGKCDKCCKGICRKYVRRKMEDTRKRDGNSHFIKR